MLDNLVPLHQWGIFPDSRPCVIAGPCSAESRAQVLETAEGVASCGVKLFRCGLWKPRTHPGCFEGAGEQGLDWLREAADIHRMKICTEVASASHAESCLEAGVDVVWLGARTTVNPFLVQEIARALGGSDIPVLVKNPVNPDADLWIGAFERLYQCGVRKMGAVLRGVSPSHKFKYRNDPAWDMAVSLRARLPQIPLFCDPSHMGGSSEYVGELSQKALDLGFEGLMIETHSNPSCALSDSLQQLTPSALRSLLGTLAVRDNDTPRVEYRDGIARLRAEIDVIDDNLLLLLARRMGISEEIGRLKKENNVAILQAGRWDSIRSAMALRARELGLSEEFVLRVLDLIHEESVAVQNTLPDE